MRQTRIVPTGIERTFGSDEIIVTKTDLRGHITYANEVFLRISAFDETDVVGRPHNLIRHPDMPRCIFDRLWSTLTEGREMFAYVVNLAQDGAHYWVYAHITPSTDRSGTRVGYHSNQRAPSLAALDRIKPLYRSLVAEEQRNSRPADALAASTALLEAELATAGLDYDAYVWTLAGVRA